MEARRKRVGVMTLTLPRERTDLAEAFGHNAVEALKAADFEVYDPGKLVFDTDTSVGVAQEFIGRGADCLLILLGTWVFAPTVVERSGRSTSRAGCGQRITRPPFR